VNRAVDGDVVAVQVTAPHTPFIRRHLNCYDSVSLLFEV
jgi:hypothetical protein